MDPEDPLIEPGMSPETDQIRMTAQQPRAIAPAPLPQPQIPQRLSSLVAMNGGQFAQQQSYGQQRGLGAGSSGPIYVNHASEIPDAGGQQMQQSSRQNEEPVRPAPIMIVVPPAAVPSEGQITGSSQSGAASRVKRQGCALPPEPGPCRGEFIRYYFDPMKMSCEIFYYGGCQGNENRFTSVKACYDICSKHASTVKKPRVLSAKKVIRVTR